MGSPFARDGRGDLEHVHAPPGKQRYGEELGFACVGSRLASQCQHVLATDLHGCRCCRLRRLFAWWGQLLLTFSREQCGRGKTLLTMALGCT